MRILVIIFFVFVSNQLFSQPPDDLNISCQDGIKKAIEDVSKGKYYLASYGLIAENPKWWDKNDFTDEYLQTNFNINLWIGGCVVTEGNQCYSDTMGKMFDKKFGIHFFDSINPIIDRMYIENIKKKILEEFVFSHVDTNAVLDYQPDSITAHIENHMDVSTKIPNGKVYIRFTVMKDGSTKDYEVFKGFDSYFDSLSIAAVKEVKVIEPAIYYGKKVNSKVIIPINFIADKNNKVRKK